MRRTLGGVGALLGAMALLGCSGSTVSATGDAAGDDVRGQPEADPPEVPDAAPDRPATDVAPDRPAMDSGADAEGPADVVDASATPDAPDDADSGPAPEDAGPRLGAFVQLGPGLRSPWLYMGMIGLAAGSEACRMLGADHVCSFEELRAAEGRGDLATIADGATFWANRSTSVMLGGVFYEAGATTCAGYTYMSGDTYDAEYGEVMGGRVTWFLDQSPTPFVRNRGTGVCGGGYAVPCCAAP